MLKRSFVLVSVLGLNIPFLLIQYLIMTPKKLSLKITLF